MNSELPDLAKAVLLPAAIGFSSAFMFSNAGSYKFLLGIGAMMFSTAAWGRYCSEASQRSHGSARRK